jgi:hypothetical protein
MTTERPFSPARWDQTPAAVQDDIRALQARLTAWAAMVQRAEATGQHVTERRPRDSRTSARPPASGPPPAPATRPRPPPRGRRPGHQGHTRAVVPGDAVDVGGPVKPARCRRGQPPWWGEEPHPQRPQGTDLPPGPPVVTAYHLQPVVGPVCEEGTQAARLRGGPTGGFGPRVPAITARCTGADHVSTPPTPERREDGCGVSMGLGPGAHLEHATVHALAARAVEAPAYGQAQPAAALDDTGGREGQPRAWLWTAGTPWGTVFVGRRSRSGQVAQDLGGNALGG